MSVVIRSLEANESIIVDGPAEITVIKTRASRCVIKVNAPRETRISHTKRPRVTLDDFPSIPVLMGVTSRVLSHDGRWMLIRYGIVKGRMARWDEASRMTALFIANVEQFDELASKPQPDGFDSWALKLFWLMPGTIANYPTHELAVQS